MFRSSRDLTVRHVSLSATTVVVLIFFLFFAVSVVAEDDVICLQGLKNSFTDPQGRLSTWSFSNASVGFICKFVGVSCWNERENRLIGLQLPSMNLAGEVPEALRYCHSLQSLDLSDNDLSGKIPSQICTWLPYLVTLDLSRNNLSGSIPRELVGCRFLNNLNLRDNRLSGSIPSELSQLSRLKKFSVANNELSGTIPSFFSRFDGSDFEGNGKLCGRPLRSKCGV